MANTVQVILRGVQFFFTLLIMALVGNMIALSIGGTASVINYQMFVAVFSMITLFYCFVVAFADGFSGHPALPALLDGLNVLFFLCGGIAFAAELGAQSCNNAEYRDTNYVTSGSWNNFQRCREGQAVTAFLWFNFALYVASLVMSASGASGSGVNMRGGIRRGPAPSMSQV